MGQALTTEEELFRRGEFSEALVKAAERDPPASTSRLPAFIMTPVEWEVLATLCDNGDSSAHVRAVAAKIDLASDLESSPGVTTIYCPLVACIAQLIAADQGVLPRDVARQRWRRVVEAVDGVMSTSCADSPLGWMEAQHRKMLSVFSSCADVEPNDARAVRRAISAALDAAADTPTGFGKRPVVALLLTYCAVSAALRCAEHVDGQISDDELSGDALEAQRTAADMFTRAVEAIHVAASHLKQGVRVAFLEMALERASTSMFNNELRELVAHRTFSATGAAKDEAATQRPLSWDSLSDVFVGQRHAVDNLRAHFQARAEGLTPSEKPTVLVFFGPSGHGKTELGRLVASIEAGGPAAPEESGDLVLVHMSSFCTRDSIYSLVDPPAAHVGEGLLISALRKKPEAVVLLDEFEKSTADAVQNVWLSAFPRNGMLRSLKEATRSVSTSKATFILTCNTMSDEIEAAAAAYTHSSSARKAALREEWSKKCRQALRDQFGEPFVARIDQFVPFVPYDTEETRAYVSTQLHHVQSKLRARGRYVEVTESFSAFATASMAERGFHGSRLESLLQPHLLALAQRDREVSDPSAASCRMLLHARPNVDGAPTIERYVGAQELRELGLTGATALARAWANECAPKPERPSEGSSLGSTPSQQSVLVTAPQPTVAAVDAAPEPEEARDVASPAAPSGLRGAPSRDENPREMELQLDKQPCRVDTVLDTVRVVELEKELATERAKNIALTREVETLKATIKQLQAALALALTTVVVLMLFLSLFVSLSTLISFAAMGVLALQYFVGNAGFILSTAVSGIIQLLGPARAAGVAGVLLAWLVWHGYPVAPTCAPCERATE